MRELAGAGAAALLLATPAEAAFEQLLEAGDVSSISGGSSSSSSEEEEGRPAGRRGRERSATDAKLVFADASGGLFAVWRAALASPRDEKEDNAWGRGCAEAAPERLRALRSSTGCARRARRQPG